MKRYIKSNTDVNEIAESIKDILDSSDYEYYGLRMDSNNYDVGDICDPSHEWFQDEDISEGLPFVEELGLWDAGELDGTCVVEIKSDPSSQYNWDYNIKDIITALNTVKMYPGEDLILVGGNSSSIGFDNGEIIIRDAVVLAKF